MRSAMLARMTRTALTRMRPPGATGGLQARNCFSLAGTGTNAGTITHKCCRPMASDRLYAIYQQYLVVII